MIRKYAEIFCWKNVSSFCSAKATHIFSAKNIRILYIESAKTVNEMTLNQLVKLTTLWTTGPCFLNKKDISSCHIWFFSPNFSPICWEVLKTVTIYDNQLFSRLHQLLTTLYIYQRGVESIKSFTSQLRKPYTPNNNIYRMSLTYTVTKYICLHP